MSRQRTIWRVLVAVLVGLVGIEGFALSSPDVASAQVEPVFPTFDDPYPDDIVDPQAPVNGCGSQGKDGVDVPDEWFGVSFTEGCNWHDRCYGTKGLSQSYCDLGMYSKIAKACEKSTFTVLCKDMGKVYLVTVAAFGGDPYQQGQIASCKRYPHRNGRAHGDPHLITFDGLRYSPMTAGEFTLVRDADGDDVVQARFLPVNESFSVVSGVAVRMGDDVIGVQQNPETSELDTYINGEKVLGRFAAVGSGFIEMSERLEGINQIATLRRHDYLRVEAVAFDGRIDLGINVFEQHFGSVTGLLGDADGNLANDLVDALTGEIRDISTAGTGAWIRELYESRFMESWRVDPADSMFTVDDGFDYHSDEARSWPKEIATLERLFGSGFDDAQQQCIENGLPPEESIDCALDVLATGDETYAKTAAASWGRATAVASPELATTPRSLLAVEDDPAPSSGDTPTVESSQLVQLIIRNDLNGLRDAINAGEPVDVLSEREQTTPLITAVALGNPSAVEMLLDAGANPNLMAGPLDALTQATSSGSLELTLILLGAGANPDGHPTDQLPLTPLTSAVRSPDIVRALLDAGADPDGGAPLYAAAQSGALEVAELLLDFGATVDLDTDPGPDVITALFAAVVADDVDMTRLLLMNGARLNAPTADLDRLVRSDEMRTLLALL